MNNPDKLAVENIGIHEINNSNLGYWPSDTSFDNCSQRPDVEKEENNDVKKTDYIETFQLIDGHEVHDREEYPPQQLVSKIKTEIFPNLDVEDVKKIEVVDTFGSVHDNESHDREELMMDDGNVLSEQINSKIDHEKLPDFEKEEVNKIEDVEIFEEFIDENGVHSREELNIKNDSNILSPQPDSIMETEETLEQHSDLKKYSCPLCDFSTNYIKSLRHHNNSIHLKLKPYKCELCDYSAYMKCNFTRHMDGHLRDNDNGEEEEDKSKNDSNAHKCHLCEFTSKYKCSLEHHISSVHLKVKRYQCQFCDYKSYWKTHFTRHIEDVHSNKEEGDFNNRPEGNDSKMEGQISPSHEKGEVKVFQQLIDETGDCSREVLTPPQIESEIREESSSDMHKEQKKYICPLCDFTTKYLKNLRNHNNAVHLKLRRYTCQLCDYGAYKKCHLKRHMEGHTKSKVQNKEDLSIQVYSKVQILENNTASEPDEPKKYKCPLCNFTTNYQKNLGHHNNSIHLKLKRYKCELCDYSAYKKYHFTSHMNGHRTGKIKTKEEKMKNNIHNCHLCDFSTKYKSNRDNHINSVHLKLKRYQCQLCDYKSYKEVHFQRHIETFHSENDPPQIDTNEEILPNFEEEDVVKIEVDESGTLGKGIPTVGKVSRMRKKIDYDLKKHKCDLCEFTSKYKYYLQTHIDSIHLNLKQHKCHLCDFTSNFKNSLQSHIEAVHLNLKQNKCDLCDFTSNYKNALQNHIKSVHLKLKPYKCQYCDYGCYRKDNLQKHVDARHLNMKEYKCHMCDYVTFSKHALKNHLNSIHHDTDQ